MMRRFQSLAVASLLALGAVCCVAAEQKDVARPEKESPAEGKAQVMVIPVREQIDDPVLFVLRRGLKEAIERKADTVILDMKTPGGSAATMLEIMEALDKFPGRTITYVNDEAGSAGALIALVTDEIYFSPNGVMGAAELITGTGADVPEALKRKMTSFLSAKVRAYSDSDPRRADVMKAMMTADFELKIGDKVLKAKGELLTLTSKEAMTEYGEPPTPLLAHGIVRSIDELLGKKYPNGNYEVTKLKITWSEETAVWLNNISPILIGLGLLALFIEFKTPGFGIFGVSGILIFAIVFLGRYVAGFSGHEPILVFGLGLLLVAVELIFFPGIALVALTGVVLMFGSLIWSMADLWPNEPLRFNGDLFVGPLINLGLGLAISVILGLLLARYLPRGWVWDKMVVGAAVTASAQTAGADPQFSQELDVIVGAEGLAATALRPSGQVEIDGRRFEAKVEIGAIEAGTAVRIVGKTDFGLIVEKIG